jgi:hypothetical protein
LVLKLAVGTTCPATRDKELVPVLGTENELTVIIISREKYVTALRC